MGGRGEGAQLSFSSSLYLDFNRGQGNEPREISFSGHTTINGGIGGPGGEGGSQGGAGGRGHGPQFHVSNVSAWHVHMNGSGHFFSHGYSGDETSLLPTPDALMPQVHDVVENGTPPPSVHISPETVQIREELSRLSGCIDELMDLVTGPVPLCVHSDSRGREKQRLSPWRFSPAGRGTKRRRDDESDGASSSVTGIISGTKRRRHDREVRARGKNSCRESSPNPPSLY
ncbi:hypothetical protein R3P38DRAFT_1705967 [Favolaschia claudopus]|uniref:Uncharacterized protein n=1 Tax=Favolaschia claudopus TaxID=2862362 RepID=A0AAW0AAS4_9AGAR